MPTFGILFILAAVFIGREVVVGRAKETPTDIKDLFVGFLNADMGSVSGVLARRGSNTGEGSDAPVTVDGSVDTSLPSLSGSSTGAQLAREVVTLGSAASGYVLGTTGPRTYDCSGLVWRACKTLGIYVGPRFTTATFAKVAPTFCKLSGTPAIGDICLWQAHGHMGVVIGPDLYYSAHSPAMGINSSSISGDSGSFGGTQPTYWRPN